MDQQPNEIICNIFGYFDWCTHFKLRLVCSKFKKIIDSEKISGPEHSTMFEVLFDENVYRLKNFISELSKNLYSSTHNDNFYPSYCMNKSHSEHFIIKYKKSFKPYIVNNCLHDNFLHYSIASLFVQLCTHLKHCIKNEGFFNYFIKKKYNSAFGVNIIEFIILFLVYYNDLLSLIKLNSITSIFDNENLYSKILKYASVYGRLNIITYTLEHSTLDENIIMPQIMNVTLMNNNISIINFISKKYSVPICNIHSKKIFCILSHTFINNHVDILKFIFNKYDPKLSFSDNIYLNNRIHTKIKSYCTNDNLNNHINNNNLDQVKFMLIIYPDLINNINPKIDNLFSNKHYKMIGLLINNGLNDIGLINKIKYYMPYRSSSFSNTLIFSTALGLIIGSVKLLKN